jgi:hypothetical protein
VQVSITLWDDPKAATSFAIAMSPGVFDQAVNIPAENRGGLFDADQAVVLAPMAARL